MFSINKKNLELFYQNEATFKKDITFAAKSHMKAI